MELENVTAEIRPRSQWEAIDLGVSLVRAHAIGLLKGWMASVYPACLLILAVCWNSIGWGLFLIWWYGWMALSDGDSRLALVEHPNVNKYHSLFFQVKV